MSATLPQTELATVTIDGVTVQVRKGTLLVEAAKAIEREIPVYCYHPKLGPAGLCRICLVAIEGMPKLQIACNTPVTDGMVVHTMNDAVNEGRRSVLELLLLNHPLDCPICDKGGECDLQDFSMAFGQGASRLAEAKSAKPKAVDLGPTIVLDEERCILCLRCVRFDDVITHERSLRTDDRGAHAIIATASGQPYVSDFSGNVTELCPVGALTSKTYRFKSRPWDNHRTATTCTQCSVGCAMNVDQRSGTITRTMSVPTDDATSDGWLCDRGRYNIAYVTDEQRLTQPLLNANGEWMQVGWDDAIAMWAKAIRETIAARGASAVGAIGGGRLLNEEAFLLQHVHRALGVENLDWRAGRQRRAWPGTTAATHEDLEHAEVIVTFGRTPAQLAPVLDLRIRKAVSVHGARLFSVGEHAASPTAERFASFEDAARAMPDVQRIALVWDGEASLDGDAASAWAAALRGKSLATYIVSEQANARGAEAVGMTPGFEALGTAELFAAARAGKLGVLTLMGVNPVLHWPDRAGVIAALDATPFVVVSDLFMTQTAELATLVLPAAAAFEKSGTTTDLTGALRDIAAAVAAPDAAWADGDMLIALAEALDITLPSAEAMVERIAELMAEPPKLEPMLAQPRTQRAGLQLIVTSAVFAGGGTASNDARVRELRAKPLARMHASTGRAHDLADGHRVDLGNGDTTLLRDLRVVFDDTVAPDAIALVDGLIEAPANIFVPNAPITITGSRRVSDGSTEGDVR